MECKLKTIDKIYNKLNDEYEPYPIETGQDVWEKQTKLCYQSHHKLWIPKRILWAILGSPIFLRDLIDQIKSKFLYWTG